MLAAPQLSKTSPAQTNQQVLRLIVLEAEQALERIHDNTTQDSWNQLYDSCSWATAFQSWGYITTWYRLNASMYTPLVVLAEYSEALVGILPLAIPLKGTGSKKRKSLVAAGHNDAEYHGWLSADAHTSHFIQAAFQALLSQFPGYDIKFRYMPAGTPVHWVSQVGQGFRCVLQASPRPLMRMQDPAVHKLFKKRGFKLKLNRLKRLGDVRFEQVHDKERFNSILPQLITQYEFRQSAMFNQANFKKNPERVELLRNLFELNLLHVTVLWLQNEIIASVVAVCGKNWVHLGGINTHSPQFAAHSPGFVHFLLLGQYLADYTPDMVFDLTPGGDSYKERMATEHDTVYSLVVTRSLSYTLKRMLRGWVHNKMLELGYSPDRVDALLKRKRYDFEKKGLQSFFNQKKVPVIAPATVLHHTASERPLQLVPVQKNNLQHLMCYTYIGTGMTKWEFLEDAMRKFDEGQSCYTYCNDNQLQACAWITRSDHNSETGCIVDSYFSEKNTQNAGRFIQSVCETLYSENVMHVTAKLDVKQTDAKKILTGIGFRATADEKLQQM